MKLWLARQSEVPVREQLVAQIILSILSDELPAGRRLPSTRELARRLKIHPNTVSAAYTALERDGWAEARRGSGVYICSRKQAQALPPEVALDQLIADFFRTAREKGAPLKQVRARLRHWLALQPPDHFLVIEPDEELRCIVVTEIAEGTSFPTTGADAGACRQPEMLAGAVPVVLVSKFDKIRAQLPAGTECLALQVRSVPGSLAQWMPIPPDALIVVASRWGDFLKWARTMLLAAGVDRDALEFRDARKPRWQDGLREATAVVTDVVTACSVPRGCRTIVFHLIADASLKALREYRQSL
ncbi:MAG: GntR family transcriptional regulator [Candidatus Acidiferrales bacterium]